MREQIKEPHVGDVDTQEQYMASYSGFIRKSPSARLAEFLSARNVELPNNFKWESEGRGTALVKELNAVLDQLPAAQQDRIKAELDHIASLANQNAMLSAEQICTAEEIDLEGLEGVQDALLMLAISHPKTLERVAVHTSLIQRTGGRNWSAFQFDEGGIPWVLGDNTARTAFEHEVIEILELTDGS